MRKAASQKKAMPDLKGGPVLRSGLVCKDSVAKHGLNALEPLEQIGEGTYGVVHKMKEAATGQFRVVKTVSRPAGWDDEQLKCEAELLQSLDHPHILRIFSWYEDGHAVNIVMEHCSGGELLRVAKEGSKATGSVPEGWAATAIRQALEALVYIHSKGVVHKDLKGDNLLLLEPTEARGSLFGNLPHVVVCDLGLAEVCRSTFTGLFKRTEHVGRAKRIAGTPSTMAPEVWSGVFGQKCDIWSIGCVMYELISLKPAFRPAKNEERLWLEAYHKGPDWQRLVICGGEEAADLAKKLLSFKEDKRPSAEEACQHNWLVKNRRSCLSPNDLEALITAVQSWPERNSMQRALCLKMAAGCTCLKKFASLFSQIDTDNSGVLETAEIVPALTKLGLSGSQAADIAAALDVNNDGSCEYLEFAAACLSSLDEEFGELLRQEFNTLNVEGKGWLRPDELDPLIIELRPLATSHGIKLEDIDGNGDGHISFAEFCSFFGRAQAHYGVHAPCEVKTLPMKHHVRILQDKKDVDEFRASMDMSMKASRDIKSQKEGQAKSVTESNLQESLQACADGAKPKALGKSRSKDRLQSPSRTSSRATSKEDAEVSRQTCGGSSASGAKKVPSAGSNKQKRTSSAGATKQLQPQTPQQLDSVGAAGHVLQAAQSHERVAKHAADQLEDTGTVSAPLTSESSAGGARSHPVSVSIIAAGSEDGTRSDPSIGIGAVLEGQLEGSQAIAAVSSSTTNAAIPENVAADIASIRTILWQISNGGSAAVAEASWTSRAASPRSDGNERPLDVDCPTAEAGAMLLPAPHIGTTDAYDTSLSASMSAPTCRSVGCSGSMFEALAWLTACSANAPDTARESWQGGHPSATDRRPVMRRVVRL